MFLSISTEAMKKTIDTIIALLVDKTNDKLIDNWDNRRKIKKILKEDIKNIKWNFGGECDEKTYELIIDFLISSGFTNVSYYSPDKLDEEQENEVWEEFKKRIETSTGDKYVNDIFKSKMINCINMHNDKVNNLILDYKTLLQMKTMKKSFERLYAGPNMLNTYTNAQGEDDKLDFFIEQLESIMSSYRYDIEALRKQQKISIICTTIIVLITDVLLCFLLKNIVDIIGGVTYYTLLVTLLTILFLAIDTYILRSIHRKLYLLEKEMEVKRNELFDIHLTIYREFLKNNFYK